MLTEILTVSLEDKEKGASPAPDSVEKGSASTSGSEENSTGAASDAHTLGLSAGKAEIPQSSYEDTYRIVKLLGRGGMSAVYLAEHKVWHNVWALKVVKKDQNAFDMLAEPNLLKQLSHPMLPHIVDIFEDDEQISIVEDYISGEDLWEYLSRNGPIPEDLAVNWLRQLCDVLNYLHTREPSPIIFRDLKPANVMLREDGSLCLVDFGIARRYNLAGGSDTVHAWTVGYAAPEQMSMNVQTDARADIYSLGATMFQLLAGPDAKYFPGQFPRIRTLRPDISPVLDEILDKCLKPFREERYSSIKELLADLDRSVSRNTSRTKKSIRVPILIAIAVVVTIAAGVFGATRILNGGSQSDTGTEQALENEQETGLSQENEHAAAQSQEAENESSDSQTGVLQVMDKESREKYDKLLIQLYGAFENSDYEKAADILQESSEQFAELCSELETGNKYLLFDEFDTGNVLAVYRYGLLYFGEWQNEQREGHGVWYALGDAEELRFEGEWVNNLPQGEGTVVITARKKPQEWGDLYPVRQERKGNFSEGFYDGDFQIHWDMSDGSTRDYTPVYYERGVSDACSSEEIVEALVSFGYTESQAEELAEAHVLDESSQNKKTIAICKDSEERIFTMVEYLENGAEPVSSVFGINY